MGIGLNIAGGLLSGTGKGMILEGQALREEKLKQLEIQSRNDLADKQNEAADARQTGLLNAQRDMNQARIDAANKRAAETQAGEDRRLKLRIDSGMDGGKLPADAKMVNWLVDNGIFPDKKAAYAARREKVVMSDADVRVKGLAWVASQKDQYGSPLYSTPEEQAAALGAYQKFVKGDEQGALEQLKTLGATKKKDAGDTGSWLKSLWQSVTGKSATGTADKTAGEKAPGSEAASATKSNAGSAAKPAGLGTQADPYQPQTQEEFAAIPAGAVYLNPADGKLYHKK